eukprot:TRINITY_DN8941_c0_g1_i2.p1 TRINITY_DN8941_c0_g1~~TRINITY_DN8941_c0_g1_i2.p1  ORF type:complete len:136 (-),score=9.47 TRINITY_DN8941_c0_g1_i2:21-428(-)
MPWSKLKFSKWGENLAATGGYLILHGGVINFFIDDPLGLSFICGGYSVVVGLLILMFFYPLKILGPILIVVNFEFLIVAPILFVLGLFPCLMLPTTIGGVTILISSVFFLVGGILREKGVHIKDCLLYTSDAADE